MGQRGEWAGERGLHPTERRLCYRAGHGGDYIITMGVLHRSTDTADLGHFMVEPSEESEGGGISGFGII